jgi:predicted metal-dependent phosphotriesterase family hydrolase
LHTGDHGKHQQWCFSSFYQEFENWRIMEYIKTGMTFEEFLTFQKETGLTDDKIKTITAAEIKEAIGKYQKQK